MPERRRSARRGYGSSAPITVIQPARAVSRNRTFQSQPLGWVVLPSQELQQRKWGRMPQRVAHQTVELYHNESWLDGHIGPATMNFRARHGTIFYSPLSGPRFHAACAHCRHLADTDGVPTAGIAAVQVMSLGCVMH